MRVFTPWSAALKDISENDVNTPSACMMLRPPNSETLKLRLLINDSGSYLEYPGTNSLVC